MPPVLAYTLFTCLGAIIGAGIIIMIGYRLNKKKPRAADMLADALDKFFNKNTERNILGDLRRANPERCKAFGHAVEEMHITFWATAVAGETGELCNLIKKMVRGDKDVRGEKNADFKILIGKEAADIVIYMDLLCTHLGINLGNSIVQKFNEVSDEINSPIKL